MSIDHDSTTRVIYMGGSATVGTSGERESDKVFELNLVDMSWSEKQEMRMSHSRGWITPFVFYW